MYTYEQRMAAVKLYIKYYHKASAVIRELGYPDRHMLVKWFEEYESTGDLHQKSLRSEKYTEDQKQTALQFYQEHGRSITLTVNMLGYPGKTTFKRWLNEVFPDRKKYCVSGGAMVEFPQEKKEQAVIDLCARVGSAKEVAEAHGVSRITLYEWKKQLLGGGKNAAMPRNTNSQKAKDGFQAEDALRAELKSLQQEVTEQEQLLQELKRDVYRLQLERDILEKAGEILKKDQGINLKTLTNHEKAELIGALRDKYRLNELLTALKISKSSYCYQAKRIREPDKYSKLRTDLSNLFTAVGGCYGYRRIHALLKKNGVTVSEKVIRRLMSEEGLVVRSIKRKKYSSYIGEISPEVANIVNRNFHAEQPNEKWLTDITEFSIPAGKVYLSPIIDCFDGLAVTWTIGVSPSSELVNSMLDAAIADLKNGEHPIIHSDRGCHYRWPGWIERMDSAGLIRSMSKKGCSPDNSACEGFFGRLKNEMFYDRSWNGVSIEEFIERLDTYLHWYNEDRIKESLNWMSPLEYRRSLGLCQVMNTEE